MRSFAGYLNRLVTASRAGAAAACAAAALAVAALACGLTSGPALARPEPDAQALATPGAPAAAPAPTDPKAAAEADLKDLQSDDPAVWQRAQSDLMRQWSSSGSAAMDLLLQRGRAAIQAGDYKLAIAHLTALVDHAPDFAEGYNARAEAYYRLGMFGPAIEDIGHVLSLNPKQYGALAGLGMILESIDKPKDALAAYRMSTAIQPHQPDVEKAIKRLEAEAAGQEL